MAARTVARIQHSRDNSPWRLPVAWAVLDCGHTAKEQPVASAVECTDCDRQAEGLAKLREAIAAGSISHSRASRFMPGRIDVYRHAPDSPTGVFHFITVDDTPEAAEILRGGFAPLSPTEAR